MDARRPISRRTLAVGVLVVAFAVGALAAMAAASSGAGGCAGSAGPGMGVVADADAVCLHLVRTLAERVGLVAAGFTALVVLTAVGVSRTAVQAQAREARPDPLSR
jgi:hypothetical protein